MKQDKNRYYHRWKKAQSAEKKSYDRQKGNWWTINSAKQYLSTNFGIGFELFKGKKVLEVGGGMGLINFIDMSCLNVGVDPLYYYLRNKLTNSKAYLIAGIGEKLPFKSNTFDIILCLNVLDHSIHPKEVIKEIKRVLKSDGLLILHLNTFQSPKIFLSKLSLLDHPHPHHFSSKEIISIIQNFGFEIRQIKETKPTFEKWKNLIAYFLFKFKIIYIVAEKAIQEEKERMGKNSKKLAEEEFEWKKIAEKYLEIYEEVVG
jgi:ubiquinone/menaquinone biosynthesis C-methylase UbiE